MKWNSETERGERKRRNMERGKQEQKTSPAIEAGQIHGQLIFQSIASGIISQFDLPLSMPIQSILPNGTVYLLISPSQSRWHGMLSAPRA